MGGIFCSYYIQNRISRLRVAILNSQLDDIKSELRAGVRQNAPDTLINSEIDTYGNTPLLFSIETRQLDAFRVLLIEFQADPNKPNSYTDFRPLHVLALARLESFPGEAQKRSFKYGNSNTAFSSEFHTVEKSKVVGKSPSSDSSNPMITNSSISDKSQHTLSHNSNKLGRVRFLTKSVDSLDDRQKYGKTLTTGFGVNHGSLSLRLISDATLKEMIHLLVEKGADLNGLARTNRSNRVGMFDMKHMTPLFLAVYTLNTVAIDEFIRLGVNCNYQEPFSKIAAIHVACKLSRVDIVSALIERGGAKVELKSRGDSTCLHWLATSERDDIGVLQLLMGHLRKIYLKDHSLEIENETFAAGLDEYLKEFLNMQNEDKQTALMIATLHNKQNLVKFLLDYDASIDATDCFGMTAINYAKHNSCGQLLSSFNKVRGITMKKSSQQLMGSKRPDSDLAAVAEKSNSGILAAYAPSTPNYQRQPSRNAPDTNSNDSYISDEFEDRRNSSMHSPEQEDDSVIVEKF